LSAWQACHARYNTATLPGRHNHGQSLYFAVALRQSLDLSGAGDYRRYLEHEGYDIPYRCLVPHEMDGLLVAGRCIWSEQQP